MSSNQTGFPRYIGSINHKTATQLAEAALAAIGTMRAFGLHKKPQAYGVCLEVSGRVVVQRLEDAPPREILMACTRTSDPDELADLIRDEAFSRDNPKRKRA